METITIDNIKYKIQKQSNGNLLLIPIKKIMINKSEQLIDYNFCKSQIISCKINDRTTDMKKYKAIQNEIYSIIDDGAQIIKNSTLNIKTIKCTDKGFTYNEDLGISVQGVNSNFCLYEIIVQCENNNIKLYIDIELDNKEKIIIII